MKSVLGRHHRILPALGLAAALLAPVPETGAQDWPQWRGPNRDGAAAFQAPPTWPDALERRWQVDVGFGYATPVLVDERVFTFTRQGEDEVMTAHDAATGEVIWRTGYAAPFQMFGATAPHGPGPKSTPAWSAGRLFTLGMSGTVTAFDAGSGDILWQHPGSAPQPMYHTAQSPLVDGDRVIVHVGGPGDAALTAFEVASGEVLWEWTGDSPAYGSPVVAELEGVRQVLTFTYENLVSVDVASGELLWSRRFVTPSNTTAQTPIIYGETVIQAGRENGFTAFRVRRTDSGWETEDLWHTNEVSVHMANPVAVGDTVYGLSHLNSGQYFALEMDTGEVAWLSAPRQAENAAMARAGDTVFSLEDDAELVILDAGDGEFAPVRRYEVAMSATWAQPAISGNRIFVKDVSSLALWTLE
jgi:outer membrane protein assembly factor BamB